LVDGGRKGGSVFRMLAYRPIAFFLVCIAVSSCAYSPENYFGSDRMCSKAYGVHLQGVDWQQAKKLNLRIRQGEFLPVYMRLLQNKSYVLAIENADDIGHTFRAIDFFKAVAVAGVRVGGGNFRKVSCLKGVSIPAGKITEVRLIPVRDGFYEFEDNALMLSFAMVGNAGGFISIDPPKKLPLSPLDQWKLFESKPINPIPKKPKLTGPFDVQEDPPAEPLSRLLDDPSSEKLIDVSPSLPAEPAFEVDPVDSKFKAPASASETGVPVVNVPDIELSEPKVPLDFGPDIESDDEPVQTEDAPVVDTNPEKTNRVPQDDTKKLFTEELWQSIPSESTLPRPQAPLSFPHSYKPINGPAADIYSDPADVFDTGPGSGGAAGEEKLDGPG
jgi:hypothetical protein